MTVGDEPFADKGRRALRTNEAVVVPVAVFERDEFGATDSSDWLGAGIAPLGKQVPITIGTVRLLVLARESLSGQRRVAVRAAEALTMPRLIFVGHAAGRDHLLALGASRRELLLVARSAKDVVVFRNERFGADGHFAVGTAEALVVPLLAFVLHLFHACTENLIASVASCRERLVVAVGAENPIVFTAERHIDEGNLAHTAQEAVLVPMLVFVGEVLRVNANRLGTLVTLIGEHVLVALDAVGLLVPHDVPLSGECLIALPTAKVVTVPVFVHRFCVLAGED